MSNVTKPKSLLSRGPVKSSTFLLKINNHSNIFKCATIYMTGKYPACIDNIRASFNFHTVVDVLHCYWTSALHLQPYVS